MISKQRSNSFQVNFGQVQERFYYEKYVYFIFCMVQNQSGSIHQRSVNQLPNCWPTGSFL